MTLFVFLDALIELAIGELNQASRFFKLPIHIPSLFLMAVLDVHLETFGKELHLMPQTFNQDSGVSLCLFDPFTKPGLYPAFF